MNNSLIRNFNINRMSLFWFNMRILMMFPLHGLSCAAVSVSNTKIGTIHCYWKLEDFYHRIVRDGHADDSVAESVRKRTNTRLFWGSQPYVSNFDVKLNENNVMCIQDQMDRIILIIWIACFCHLQERIHIKRKIENSNAPTYWMMKMLRYICLTRRESII